MTTVKYSATLIPQYQKELDAKERLEKKRKIKTHIAF